MLVLGIDQSYKSTGIVLLEDGAQVVEALTFTAETVKIVKKVEVEIDRFDQSVEIAKFIGNYAVKHLPEAIGVEGLAHGGLGSMTRDLAGLQFTIINHLRTLNFRRLELIPPTTVKKFATGKGNSKKEVLYEFLPESIKRLFDEEGFKKSKGRSDVTDAYWIARFLLENNDVT